MISCFQRHRSASSSQVNQAAVHTSLEAVRINPTHLTGLLLKALGVLHLTPET
jgi:hypothetical protein